MKALIYTGDRENPVKIIDKEKPLVKAGQVLVKMTASALNHRDQWMRVGKYPGMQPGVTLGSDGCGMVEEIGPGVDATWQGKAVIINPNNHWGDDEKAQSSNYTIMGMPLDGTFAEYLVVDEDRLHSKPESLSDEEAGALPLGGLTAYRACFTQGEIGKGSRVLITGIGGGVALFALQFSVVAGADVYVSSSSRDKINHAIELGAKQGFDYKDENWVKEAKDASGGFDVVIDSAGGKAINDYLKIINPGGRLVFFGSTLGMPDSLDLFRIFWQQIRLQGTTMGSDKEFAEMVDLVNRHKLKPVIDSVRPFMEIISAMDDMESGKQVGKLVLKF